MAYSFNVYDIQRYQRIWEMVRAQEWERVYRRWLEECRRMVLYHLQWGTPTGPYWAPTPTRPWWIDGAVWSYLQQAVIGSPPYLPTLQAEAWHNPRQRLTPIWL